MKVIDIILTNEKLSLEKAVDFVRAEQAGGIVTFVGTVRNQTKGKKVIRLEFEAYEKMALSEMRKIAEQILFDFEINSVAIYHRTGNLSIGEIPVVIAVSAPHRKAAFAACEFAMDRLKKTVPIWKKEFFEDGAVWVSAHP